MESPENNTYSIQALFRLYSGIFMSFSDPEKYSKVRSASHMGTETFLQFPLFRSLQQSTLCQHSVLIIQASKNSDRIVCSALQVSVKNRKTYFDGRFIALVSTGM